MTLYLMETDNNAISKIAFFHKISKIRVITIFSSIRIK